MVCAAGAIGQLRELYITTTIAFTISSVYAAARAVAINMINFKTYQEGDILTWQQVNLVHEIRNGIYQKNGRLKSLLTDFGRINPCYPDTHGVSDDIILYTGNGRRGDQKLDAQNRALLDAVGMSESVPLFNKLAPGEWRYMGTWRVTDAVYVFEAKQDRMVWRFTLVRDG